MRRQLRLANIAAHNAAQQRQVGQQQPVKVEAPKVAKPVKRKAATKTKAKKGK